MNNEIKTIFKIFGSEIILKIILGLTSILIARKLDTQSFADFFYFITITNLCINIPSSFFNKFFFTDKNKQLLEKFENFSLILYLVLISSTLLLVITIINPFDSFLLFFLSLLIISMRVLFIFFQTFLQSELNFKKFYLREITRVVLYSFPVILYLLLISGPKIEIIIIIQISSFLLTEMIFSFNSTISFSITQISQLTNTFFNKENKFIFLFTISLMILTSIDTIMLKALSNEVEMSMFGSAFTLYAFLMLGLSSIHKYVLPKASLSKISEFEEIMRPIFKIGYIIIPFFIIGLFFSESFFNLIYGEGKFPNAHIVFNILSSSAVLSFFFSPYSNLLNKVGEFKIQLNFCIAGIILIIILNYFLIPIYGAIAVSLNNITVYFLLNFSFYYKAKQIIKLETD